MKNDTNKFVFHILQFGQHLVNKIMLTKCHFIICNMNQQSFEKFIFGDFGQHTCVDESIL